MDGSVKYVVGGAIALVFLFALTPVIMSHYSSAQVTTTLYEDVATSDDWNSSLQDGQSGYSISNGELTVNNDTTILTKNVNTSDYDSDRLVVEATGVTDTMDVNVVDGTGTTLDTISLNGSETKSVELGSYSASEYHLEFASGTDGDATVDSYTVNGETDVDDTIQAVMLMVLITFFLAVAFMVYKET